MLLMLLSALPPGHLSCWKAVVLRNTGRALLQATAPLARNEEWTRGEVVHGVFGIDNSSEFSYSEGTVGRTFVLFSIYLAF